MALLHSEKKTLGSLAPDFSLKGVDGKSYSLKDFEKSKVLVVMFICNHCPYVQAIEDRIIALQRHFDDQSVRLVGICSNDSTNYPDDSFENLKKRWETKKYSFPYLVDETQQTAKDYGAVCTPDLYVFDQNRQLAYHGRLDDNWQDPKKVTKEDLKEAVQFLLQGKKPASDQTSSMGCSIKWKS